MASHKAGSSCDPGQGAVDRRVAVLRHTTGGAHHFDWLFEIGTGEDDRLETWRCVLRPDLARSGDVVRAERLEDHRRAYLEYEGEISEDRGEVNRVSQGTYWAAPDDQAGGSEVRIRVIRWSSGITQRWIFESGGVRCLFSGHDSED